MSGNTVFLKQYLKFWDVLVHRHLIHQCLTPQDYLIWWTCTWGQVPVLGKRRLMCATCLKVVLMTVPLRQLACWKHHEVHCCDCIKKKKSTCHWDNAVVSLELPVNNSLYHKKKYTYFATSLWSVDTLHRMSIATTLSFTPRLRSLSRIWGQACIAAACI